MAIAYKIGFNSLHNVFNYSTTLPQCGVSSELTEYCNSFALVGDNEHYSFRGMHYNTNYGGGLSLYNCLRHYLVKSNAAKGVEAINKYITLTGERFNVPHDLTVLYITLLMGSIPERNPFINEKAIGEAKSSYDLLVELGRLSGPFGTKLSINLLGKDCGKTEIDEILKLIIGKI